MPNNCNSNTSSDQLDLDANEIVQTSDKQRLLRLNGILPKLKAKLMPAETVKCGTQYQDLLDYTGRVSWKRHEQAVSKIDAGLRSHFMQAAPYVTEEAGRPVSARGGFGLLGNFDGRTPFVVFDADNSFLASIAEGQIIPELRRSAIDFIHALSGTPEQKRSHIWIFTDLLPIHIVRRFADRIAELSRCEPFMPGAIKDAENKLFEVMPTHTNNIIRLPGGFHLRNGKRNPIEFTGKVTDDAVEIAEAIIACKPVTLEFMEAYGVDVLSPPPPKPAKAEPIDYGPIDDLILAAVEEALQYIELPETGGFHLWRDITMAGKSAGIPREILDAWARTQPNYDEKNNLVLWDSFSDEPDAGLSLGTIIYHARQGGWLGKLPRRVPTPGDDFTDFTPEKISELQLRADKHVLKDTLLSLARRVINGDIAEKGLEVSQKLTELAADKKVTKASLQEEFKHLVSKLAKHVASKKAEPLVNKEKEEEDARIDAAAEELLKSPNLFKAFHPDFALTGYLADEVLTSVMLLLLGRTLMPKSSGQYHYGKSSSGKTECVSASCRFFPPERVITITKATPKFLTRFGELDGGCKLSNKLVNICEIQPVRDGEDDPNQETMRQMISDNMATLATIENVHGIGLVPEIKKAYGPVTFVSTGTCSPVQFDDQIVNRQTSYWHNLTQEKIREVIGSKATTGSISSNPSKLEDGSAHRRMLVWQQFFRKLYGVIPQIPERSLPFTTVQPEWLKPETEKQQRSTDEPLIRSLDICEYGFDGIEIPYLPRIKFGRKRLTESDSRTFDILKTAIATSAVLHQRSREIITTEDGRRYIVASIEDLDNVLPAYHAMVPNTAQAISKDLLERLSSITPKWRLCEASKMEQPQAGHGLSYAEIADLLGGVPVATAKRWVYAWIGADLVLEEPFVIGHRSKRFMLAVDCEELTARMKECARIDVILLPPEIERTDERQDSESAANLPLDTFEDQMNGSERSVNVHSVDPYACLAGL